MMKLTRLAACFLLLIAHLSLFSCYAVADGEWPELNENGYLNEGEFIYENAQDGIWRYCSETLKIEITRQFETDPLKVTWYEAEIWSRSETFDFVTDRLNEHFRKTDWPVNVCSKRGAVFAINGDYACGRWSYTRSQKQRNSVGILIRDGEIQSTYTKKSGNGSFPNLDTLALYDNGLMEVYDSKELSAEQYIEKGTRHVLAFGPWLIRNGQLNPVLAKYNHNRAPRTAIGMIENGHYIAIVVEGRHKYSKGSDIHFLANRLLQLGCTTGFNLDGGETSCMLFMGKQINKVGSAHNSRGYARKGAEFLSIGISSKVDGYNPDAP